MAKTNKKDIASAMGIEEYTPPKPTMTLNEKDCPEIKNYKVDQEVQFTVKGKVIEVSRPRWGDKKQLTAVVEMSNIKSYDGNADDETDE